MRNLPNDVLLEQSRRRIHRIRAVIFAILSVFGIALFIIAYTLYRRMDPQGNLAPIFWGLAIIGGLVWVGLSTAFFDYPALFRRKP